MANRTFRASQLTPCPYDAETVLPVRHALKAGAAALRGKDAATARGMGPLSVHGRPQERPAGCCRCRQEGRGRHRQGDAHVPPARRGAPPASATGSRWRGRANGLAPWGLSSARGRSDGVVDGTHHPNPPAHRLGYWPAAECPSGAQLTASAPEAGKPRRRASVRVSLTATQAREIADGLYKMADATVMGQTPVAPPSQAKN